MGGVLTMKHWSDDPTWNERAGAWFAGYVFGLLSACALAIASGGCWSGTAHCPETGPTYTLRQGAAPKPCTHDMPLPERPEFFSCSDSDEYWYCRAVRLDAYNDKLTSWITNAIARCAP